MRTVLRFTLRQPWTLCIVAAGIAGLATPLVVTAAINGRHETPPAKIPAINDGIPWLVALNGVIRSAPNGKLPNGCATLRGYRVCVPSVTVDSVPLSDVELLEGMLATATRATGDAEPSAAQVELVLRSDSDSQVAVANAVAEQLLFEQGMATIDSPLTQANAMARQQLAYYLADPAAGEVAEVIPAGVSAHQYFLSKPVISGYERLIAIGHEELVLTTDHVSLAAWITDQLTIHHVLVDGQMPTFSIPGLMSIG
jgi:glucose/arabinose dehydrogenase